MRKVHIVHYPAAVSEDADVTYCGRLYFSRGPGERDLPGRSVALEADLLDNVPPGERRGKITRGSPYCCQCLAVVRRIRG